MVYSTPMQIDALKVFIEVVRKGSFTEAAKTRDLSQSAVSQVVRQLEDRLGVELINRRQQPVKPTKLGQVYYKGCERVIQAFDELEASVRQADAQLPVRISMAAIYSVGLGDMGQYVECFRAMQPNVEIHIDYLHPDRVYERVLAGTADFGLVSFPRTARGLATLPWREEEMVL